MVVKRGCGWIEYTLHGALELDHMAGGWLCALDLQILGLGPVELSFLPVEYFLRWKSCLSWSECHHSLGIEHINRPSSIR